jgi:hypothetical protein
MFYKAVKPHAEKKDANLKSRNKVPTTELYNFNLRKKS